MEDIAKDIANDTEVSNEHATENMNGCEIVKCSEKYAGLISKFVENGVLVSEICAGDRRSHVESVLAQHKEIHPLSENDDMPTHAYMTVILTTENQSKVASIIENAMKSMPNVIRGIDINLHIGWDEKIIEFLAQKWKGEQNRTVTLSSNSLDGGLTSHMSNEFFEVLEEVIENAIVSEFSHNLSIAQHHANINKITKLTNKVRQVVGLKTPIEILNEWGLTDVR